MDYKGKVYFITEVRIILRNILQTFLARARVAQITVIPQISFTRTMFKSARAIDAKPMATERSASSRKFHTEGDVS